MSKIQSHVFEQVYSIMEESFPLIEYRSFEGQQALLTNASYRLLTKENDLGEVIAFLGGWEFDEFCFVEHIAVKPSIRGGGQGKQLMMDFIAQTNKPVVLEVEPPDEEIKQRRIGFYERLGFHVNSYPYVQPPLREGQPDFPLLLLSYPSLLTEEQFQSYRDTLYAEVYQVISK
ncbi:GNAT family N-acetyltransferase [Paenibacillus gallinarum]|uniref:GNAT family N-acetyltransferase n=1 Tax=Paenibacillus gallinarum TaxID=2762232 RepID=A0ABR8T321_9BACL|nr:GNAT family N-acetyltransferase [Paenibacillus gallinarum]MBD7970173.1 GNAT family N-acetyltransferase [Paenibacillus gallinarum]